MKKKLTIFFIALMCLLALGCTIKTNAFVGDGKESFSYPQAYYADIVELGLSDATVEYDVTFGEEMTITRNGFKFTRSGDIATVEPADDAATVKTLYFSLTIDSKTIDSEQYLNLDYTKFPNVRNVVINCDLENGILAKINKLQSIQNVFILQGCNLTNLNNPQIKNYILLENYLSDAYSLANQDYLNLSEYNREAKFVTIESLKYVALSHLRTYTQNINYKGTESIDLYLIKDDDFFCDVLPEDYDVNVTKEVNGGYYTRYELTGYSTKYYMLVDINPMVKKIIVGEDVTGFKGVYLDIPLYLDQIYYKSTYAGLEKLHADVLITPSPSYFYNVNYKNYKEVYFYKSGIGATARLSIYNESLKEGEEVTTKYKTGSSVEVTNYADDTTLYDAFVTGQTIPSACFEIHHINYSASTTSSTKTLADLIGVINLHGLGTNDGVTVEELEYSPIDKEEGELPIYPDDDEKDETGKEENDKTDKEENDKTDKDDENDTNIKVEINNFFNSFKEKFEQNKAVKAITIIISVSFGLGLIYLVYVLIKKFTKFFK